MKYKKILLTTALISAMTTSVFANETVSETFIETQTEIINNDTDNELVATPKEKLSSDNYFVGTKNLAIDDFTFYNGTGGTNQTMTSRYKFTNMTTGKLNVTTISGYGIATLKIIRKSTSGTTVVSTLEIPSGVTKTYTLSNFNPNAEYYIQVDGSYFIDGEIKRTN